jgi:ribosomal protein L29
VKKTTILELEDPKELNELLIQKQAELRLSRTNFGTAIKPTPKEVGKIKNLRKDIARIYTRLNQINKNFCKKGGKHFEGKTRDNRKICKKCGVSL